MNYFIYGSIYAHLCTMNIIIIYNLSINDGSIIEHGLYNGLLLWECGYAPCWAAWAGSD